MFFHISSTARARLAGRFSAAVVATYALLALCVAGRAAAQTSYSVTGSGITLNTSVSSGSSTAVVPSGDAGTIATVQVTLNGLSADGNLQSLGYTSVLLEGPNGRYLMLLGGTGAATENIGGLDVTLKDGATLAPQCSGVGTCYSWPTSGSVTYSPGSFWYNDNGGSIPSPWNAFPYYLPADDGQQNGGSNATFNTSGSGLFNTFGGVSSAGAWTLSIVNDLSYTSPHDVSITGWTLTLTYEAAQATATSISSSVNPSFTASPNSSTTFLATVTSGGSGVSGGTVTFTDTTTNAILCSGVTVAGGSAPCAATLTSQGIHNIEAVYAGDATYATSGNSMSQLVEVHATQTSDLWCNSDPITIPGGGGGAGSVYPSVINVSGYPAGTTVSNVEVELLGETGTIYGQHLLVAPDGTHNLDFLDGAWDDSTSSSLNLDFYDSAGAYPDYPNETNEPSGGNYEASDDLPTGTNPDTFPSATAPIIDTSIPKVPATVTYAYNPLFPGEKGASTNTFENEIGGAPANGDWALYTYEDASFNETIGSGWCIELTLNTGVTTSTALSSSANPQIAKQAATLTASVTASGSPVTSGGTVTFLDNGATPSGDSTNVVNLNTSSGQAAFGTGTTSYTVNSGNGSQLAIYEGDHNFTAEYSGTASDNPSGSATFWQRFDNLTSAPTGTPGSNQYSYCNAGPVISAQGNSGPFLPNPSNIFVTNLPGTVSSVGVTLNGLYTEGETSTNMETMLAGPNHVGLDFFSNAGSTGSTTSFNSGNYTFSDGASESVPQSVFSAGTYLPTSYGSSADSFTASKSGFYNLPGTIGYAAPHGSSTFAGSFADTNGNGAWSLFFNEAAAEDATGAMQGWCLNFTQNPETVTVTESHSGSGSGGDFAQGESGAQITTVVTNSGSGPTGDPLGTNPLTLVDTLNSALTYQSFSGTGWSCSASGQTVTCTNDSAVASSSPYPTLTLNVNVLSSAPTSFTNSASVSGAGITPNSGADTIDVESSTTLAIAKTHTPSQFTQGSTGVWTLTVEDTAPSGSTSGTVTVSDTLPTGYTLNSYTSTSNLWSCGSAGAIVTCTATPGIAGGGNNTIALTVNVPAASPVSVSNTAYAYGGGDSTHTSLATAAASNTDTVTVTQAPATVVIASGNSQSAPAAAAFSVPLVVTITDGGGNPISGQSVTFTAPASGPSGTFSNSSTTIAVSTNGSGQATAPFTANAVAGAYTVTASAGAATPVSFSLTNIAGPAATVAVVSGNSQSAIVGLSFSSPLLVLVTDAYGNPVAGATVSFAAPGSGASAVLSTPGVTDGFGHTSVTATANETAGSYTVTAAVSGYPALGTVSFALTNSPPPNLVVTTAQDDLNATASSPAGTASNCTVQTSTTTGTDASCSLRDALTEAANLGTANIYFSSTVFATAQILVLHGDNADNYDPVNIPQYTTIHGPTSGSGYTLTNLLTIQPSGMEGGAFNINSGVQGAAIANVTINGGDDTEAGAITNQGTLTVTECTLSNNGTDGAIENQGTLTVIGSTFVGNVNENYWGGAIENDGTATVINSTFYENSSYVGGGAIGAMGAHGIATTVINSTFSGNAVANNTSTGFGYGQGPDINVQTGTLTTDNDIFYDGDSSCYDGGPDTCSTGPVSYGNIYHTAPIVQLAPLGNYGGPTQTLPPLPGSLAVCWGVQAEIPAGVTTDQRGLPITGGGYCPAGYMDAGAVQTDYALSLTQQPASVITGATMSPAPAVTLTESGLPFTAASIPIPLTLNGNGTLTGGSGSTASGVATYTGLSVSAAGTGDTLTASLKLTYFPDQPANPEPVLTATSNPFNVNSTLLVVSAPGAVVAGVPFRVTVTVEGANSATDNDTVNLTITGTSTSVGTVTLSGGTGSAMVTLSAVGAVTLTGTDTSSSFSTGTSGSIAVNTVAPTALAASEGTPQSAYVNTAFATPLQATLTSSGNNPVAGVTIEFAAPSSGAGAALSAPSCVTGANGSCSVTATANSAAGSYDVTASVSGYSSLTVSFALTNSSPPNLVVTTTQDDAGTVSNCTVQSSTATGTDASCSLRDALAAAAVLGTADIYFDTARAAGSTITITAGTLNVPSYTAILGPASRVTVSANLKNTVFAVAGGVTGAAISNLTIIDGYSAVGGENSGGGITNAGALTVTGVVISGSHSSWGAGINNTGTLTVQDSTITGNSANLYGNTGSGGGIASTGTLTVEESTVYDNNAANGGGIYVENGGATTIQGSTIVDNTALLGTTNPSGAYGGGIDVSSGTLTLNNSIVAGNSAAVSNGDIVGNYTGAGNLASNNSDTGSTINPGLSALGNYGGATQTLIPLPGSPAICAGLRGGIGSGVTTDQRGQPLTGGGYCPAGSMDAGAVQTDYALSFTQQPVSVLPGVTMSPAPAVTFTESGSPFSAVSVSLPLTLSGNGTLTGGTESTVNGVATYTGLSVSAAGTGDTLTTSLTLNPGVSPAAAVSVTSNPFDMASPSILTVSAGTPQAADTNSVFATALTARVTDSNGNGVSGIMVNFTAPSSGASAALSAASCVTTGPGGACSVTATANGTLGSYNVTASVSGYSSLGTVSFALTNQLAQLVVNTTADDATGAATNCTTTGETCTLRDALAAASAAGAGNITFSPTVFSAANTTAQNTITLTSGNTLNISSNTTIQGVTGGSGSSLTNLVTVSGNNATTVFTVGTGVTGAEIENLTVTNGSNSNNPGGGLVNAGTLTLNGVSFTGNSAARGGAIYNNVGGNLTLLNSTLYSNQANYSLSTPYGGAIFNSEATLTIENSTIEGNEVNPSNSNPGYAGAINNLRGVLTMTGVTIANNQAIGSGSYAAGIFSLDGTLTVENSVFAGNTDSGNVEDDCQAVGATCPANGTNGDVIGTASAVELGSLNSYGGPTQTMIPLPGSAAICAGSYSLAQTAGITSDERGVSIGSTGAGGYCPTGSVDAGAVQTNYSLAFSTNPPATVASAINFSAAVTLDESGSPFAASAVTIPLTLTGTGTLSGGLASTATGVASYSSLQVSAEGTGDTLTANLALNPAITPNGPAISTVSSSFSVQAAPTLSFTLSPNSQTYGTAISSLNASASYNGSSVAGTFAYTTTVNGGTETLSAGTTVLPVGTYTITATFTPSDRTDYATASQTASYTVSPAALTITAGNGSFVYGGAVPAIAPSYSGFVGTDAASSLTTAPTCSTTATSTSAVRSYPSTCSGAVDANYTISYVAGSVSVTQAALTVTAGNTNTLSGTVPTVIPSYSGFVAGNTQASLTTAASCTSTVTATTPVGTYTGANTCAGAVDANYVISYVAGTATVTLGTAQSINFTQPSSPVVYGTSSISLSATATSGLPVAFSVVSGPGTISGSRLTVTGAGTIVIAANQAGNTNYTAATQVTQSIVVSPAALTIAANSATKVYGTANPAFTGSVTGQQNGDTFTESFTTAATIASPVGAYAIVPSVTGANLSDYTQSVADGTLTVTQAASITTLHLSSTSITPGQSVTLTATVASATTGAPTGTVNFYDGSVLLNSTPVALSGGVATYSTTALVPGTENSIIAIYSGDVNFLPSNSNVYGAGSVNVGQLDFTMTLSGPSSLTVVPGQSVSYQVHVNPDYGSYAGTVSFAVSGLPPGATVTFSPASIAANSGPQTVTITIQTASATAARHDPPAGRNLAPLALGFLVLFGAGALRRGRRTVRAMLCVLLLAAGGAAATLVSGCGGHGGFQTQAPENYTVVVTATAGSVQHSMSITLNVQ